MIGEMVRIGTAVGAALALVLFLTAGVWYSVSRVIDEVRARRIAREFRDAGGLPIARLPISKGRRSGRA